MSNCASDHHYRSKKYRSKPGAAAL